MLIQMMFTDVVEGVEDNVEFLEEGKREGGHVHDISHMGNNLCIRVHCAHSLCSHLGLVLANMAATEQELAVKITQLDRIQIHL